MNLGRLLREGKNTLGTDVEAGPCRGALRRAAPTVWAGGTHHLPGSSRGSFFCRP